MDVETIKSIIEKMIEQNMLLYVGDGCFERVNAIINDKNSISRINGFEEKINCSLPKDYKRFLLACDGIKFLSSSELSLYSIDEIMEVMNCMDYIDGVIPIGYCLEEYIVINCKEACSDKYMYAGDAYCPDEYYSLDCSFTDFLERSIVSNFNNYWSWMKPQKKYKFIDV